MRFAALLILTCLSLLPVSVQAQDAAAKTAVTSDAAKRTELATEIHKHFNVQERLFRSMESVTNLMSPSQQREFWGKINTTMTKERLNAVSIPVMADTFTVPELQAMLTYYGSQAGQSAEQKRPDYETKAMDGFRKLIDEAVVNTGPLTKPTRSLYSR